MLSLLCILHIIVKGPTLCFGNMLVLWAQILYCVPFFVGSNSVPCPPFVCVCARILFDKNVIWIQLQGGGQKFGSGRRAVERNFAIITRWLSPFLHLQNKLHDWYELKISYPASVCILCLLTVLCRGSFLWKLTLLIKTPDNCQIFRTTDQRQVGCGAEQ